MTYFKQSINFMGDDDETVKSLDQQPDTSSPIGWCLFFFKKYIPQTTP